jgi:hypothetical protein
MTTEISTNTQPKGLALQTFADAMKFAEMVANSDFAPKDFRGKPASCLLAIQAGGEISLAPLQALQSIAVVNGRPAVFGDAALAVTKASPVCEYVTEKVEGDGEQMVATCTAKRRGYPEPTVVRFSVADAKKAGLWGKTGPWTQYPKRMLQMRARGFALRDAFPDVLKGLVTAEEAQDYQTPAVSEPTPSVIKVTAAAAAPVVPEDPMGKAKLAISRATTFDMLDAIRTLVDKRAAEGVFDEAGKQALVGLIHQKAERLIGEDKGQEFAHEAAEHEVTG